MRVHIKVAALVVLLAVTICTAIDQVQGQGGLPAGDESILGVLGIKSAAGLDAPPGIDISSIVFWIDKNRFGVEVVGEAETEPRGLLGRKWSQRQVAEIEFLEMPSEYCKLVDIETPCCLVAKANEHGELKAPLGTWHVTSEDVPGLYTGLPSAGATVNIPSATLSALSRQ